MGMDIHMSIVKDGKVLAEDIFDGRNTLWFNNLMGEGSDSEYDYLPIRYGVSPQASKELNEEYNEDFLFGRNYISVGEFHRWFNKYKPNIDAGWVSAYEKWAWENKHIIPEQIFHSFPEGENPIDWHFIEFEKRYDCSRWLYDFLIENKVPDDADITYCFDW